MKNLIQILLLFCLTMANCQKMRELDEKFIATPNIIDSPPPIEELYVFTVQEIPENTDIPFDEINREIAELFLEIIGEMENAQIY